MPRLEAASTTQTSASCRDATGTTMTPVNDRSMPATFSDSAAGDTSGSVTRTT